MAILVPALDESNGSFKLLSSLRFLTQLVGIIDGAIDANNLTEEQKADLIAIASILNRYDDLSLARATIRGYRMKPLDALLRYSQACKRQMGQEFEKVLQQVRTSLGGLNAQSPNNT